MGEISKLRSLPDVVAEYDAKLAAIPEAMHAFADAGTALKTAASVGGQYGQENIDTGGRGIYQSTLERNLLRSAWLHVWNGLNLPAIASANDKKKWEMAMTAPAPFTLDNLRATFGPYLENPRATILRGLAEVFSELDPAYKSHEKVKIGVKGLPKRVIMHGFGKWSRHGQNGLTDIARALSAYRGEALPTQNEVHEAVNEAHKHGKADWRGGYLRVFDNGNCHVFFDTSALTDINRALAEFYGDVLADSPEAEAERPAPRHTGTAVAKDLQFYPTPKAVIDIMLKDIDPLRGMGLRVLEPSCGDGRIMDALRDAGFRPYGIEVDAARANAARAKGHGVMTHNFLTLRPQSGPHWESFDLVVMNPPFYGKHYAKHVTNATRFLKPGGLLISVLPYTARDHGLLDDAWAEANGMLPARNGYRAPQQFTDLPIGSFRESGTGIHTVIFQSRKKG